MASEFAIIEHYFTGLGAHRDDVLLGVGDDAALLEPGGGPLVSAAAAGVVERSEGAPSRAGEIGAALVGEACAALAGRGVTPRWATISLTLPDADERWIEAFARGVDQAARAHGVAVVGGDTTAGAGMVVVFASGVGAGNPESP